MRRVSIDEAVQSALRLNPTVEQQQAAIRRAIGFLDETRVALRPTFFGNANFSLQGPIATFSITTPPTTPGGVASTQNIALGRVFTRGVTVSGSYSPDIFGSRLDNRTAARRDVFATRGGLYQVQNDLVFSVQNLYLAGLRNQELITVAREAIVAAQEQLRVAEAQFRAGTAPEFDVIRAQVQVANLRQTEVTAGANYRRTLANLASTLSLEPNTRVELDPVALPPEPDALAIETARSITEGNGLEIGSFNTPANLETALREAFSNRPEIYSAFWSRRAADARVSAARKGNRPVLSFDAGFQYNPDVTGFAVVKRTYSLVANVAIPIWDAGLSRARTDQARADVQSAQAQIRAAQDAVTQEVRTSLLDLEESRERRRSAAANTAQAREALRIARVRYQAGLAPNVEVTDAEAALTQSRSNEVNAAYDYLAALANLNRSLGRYAGDALSRATAVRP